VILPAFYRRDNEYAKVMRYSIALNGAFFNTHRMLSQYISNAYGAGARNAATQAVPRR
jgi:starch phosphorylase